MSHLEKIDLQKNICELNEISGTAILMKIK
jgi:hypothetical protein